MYFKKLDLEIDIPSYEIGKKEIEYGLEIDNNFTGLWYSNLKLTDKIDFIPKEYKSNFYLLFLEANSYILPHSDSGPTAVINFYIETNNCATQFYEVKDNAEPYQIETDSFIAQPGDIYILNVNKIHSVIPLDNQEINRKAICFSTNSLTFNEVERMFNQP